MKLTEYTIDELILKNEELQARLSEAEEALNAIRNGDVDAIVVSGQSGEKVFTLTSADAPYRLILEEMGEGAAVIKSDGAILYCNHRFTDIFSDSTQTVIGLNLISLVSEVERLKLRKFLEKGLKERITGIISHFSSLSENASYLNISLRPLPAGVEGDICLIVSDITIMQQYQDHLQDMVIERTLEIEKANEQLRELNATKNKFFNIIAHDLTSPFTSLLGASELLVENMNLLNPEKIKTLVMILKEASKNGYSILQDLLEWSRSQTGMLVLDPGRINLRDLIDEQIRNVSLVSAYKEIEICSLVKNDTYIFTDRNFLNTILRNLISNAIKFSNRNGKVLISSEVIGNEIIVSVKDNGIGISQENIENIFKLDNKYKRPGTDNEQGTGLGLKICHEFVEKLNGSIWVVSCENQGSEFKFSIPIEGGQFI